MADSYRVRIDMRTLRANLARAEGKESSVEEVTAWLERVGFVRAGSDWICEEDTLRVLGDGEVLSVEPYA